MDEFIAMYRERLGPLMEESRQQDADEGREQVNGQDQDQNQGQDQDQDLDGVQDQAGEALRKEKRLHGFRLWKQTVVSLEKESKRRMALAVEKSNFDQQFSCFFHWQGYAAKKKVRSIPVLITCVV